jgi:colanic acid/amylovoran biosynthesis glycosyltransferase
VETSLNIAYLMSTYPMTSTTFIRREIEALEELGVNIPRYAVREWDGALVDPRDVREKKRTLYLLTNSVRGLFVSSILTLLFNPVGLWRALKVWMKLLRNADGRYVKHFAYLMQATYFSRLTRLEKIDHVHVHFATNATTVALLARQLGGPSYSFTVHGPDELLEPVALSFSLKIEHAAFIVAISQFCKDFLQAYAPPDCSNKIVIARCGLALEEFNSDQPVQKSDHTLVCVGRLCPQKGQILIPKAAAQLKERFPDLKIILIGDGEIRRDLETEIKRCGVEDVVELRGWVENRSVLELVRSSRALLLPSFAEGLPVVIMEALALGTPVISTTIAGIPELVDENCGWLFPPGDEQGLVAAMQAALECPAEQLQRMSGAGRGRVSRLHDRRELARVLFEKFSQVVAEHKSASVLKSRLAMSQLKRRASGGDR